MTADQNKTPPEAEKPKGRKLSVPDFLLAFLVPTIFGKIMVVYFGLNYSAHPDRGYGVGLIISILFTLSMIGRFIWRYRDYDDS